MVEGVGVGTEEASLGDGGDGDGVDAGVSFWISYVSLSFSLAGGDGGGDGSCEYWRW